MHSFSSLSLFLGMGSFSILFKGRYSTANVISPWNTVWGTFFPLSVVQPRWAEGRFEFVLEPLLGVLMFLLPLRSSPNIICFGKRLLSILATWPAQRSLFLRSKASTLFSVTFTKVSTSDISGCSVSNRDSVDGNALGSLSGACK